MQSLAESTITTAVASGATTGLILAADINSLASNDWVAIELDNGGTQFTTVATGTYSGFSISDALTDTVAVGNKVWTFGISTDNGHIKFQLTASVQTEQSLDGGVFYATSKGDPMLVYHANNAAAAGSIDYLTIDYINK
jgi:hypothetical protein